MTHPTDDSLKPCPFCGSQPEPAPYVLKCVNAYCEAQPSVSGGNDDECATAWNKRALLAEQSRPEQETDRDWSEAQDWKGMDGAQAWHLIYRHADGWGDTGAMMNAWLAANAAPPMTHKAEDAPSDELPRFNEAKERAAFEAHLKAELKAHWLYNNPNGHDLVDMMVSVISDEVNGHKQTNAGRYVDKGVETQWHGWRARAECAAIAQERKA